MKLLLIKIIRFISMLDAFLKKLPRYLIKPLWRRTGKCKQCGRCCKLIGIEMEHRLAKFSAIQGFVVWWVKTFNGFHLDKWDKKYEIFLFTCEHLKKNRCTNYKDRPQLCKDYPPVRKYFEKPIFFDDCGFKAEKISS
jgi:uncharacterized protein